MINENYKFIPKKSYIFFQYIAYPFFYLFCKLFFGFKVINKDQLKLIQSGTITVSNHIHFLDNILIYLAFFPKKHYFITNKANIETPLIRFFVRGFGGIPVPESKKAMKEYINSIKKALLQGITVHFFPEGSISPYDKTIRKFNDGAFRIAINNQVPILPLTFVYQKPTGFIKYFRRKPYIHLVIDQPIYSIGDYQQLKLVISEIMHQNMEELK